MSLVRRLFIRLKGTRLYSKASIYFYNSISKKILIDHLWINVFIDEVGKIFNQIEIFEGKKLPFTSSFLSSLSAEILLKKNEDIKTWAGFFGNNFKKNDQVTLIDNKKMKIVFVTGVFPGTSHGGGLRIFDMIHELILNGHEVHLYTSNLQLETGEAIDLLKSLCKSFNVVESSQLTLPNLEDWLEKNDHYFDIGYFVWPSTVNLFLKDKKRIKKIAFEYIECTTRRLWLDLQSFNFDTDANKISNTLHDFLTHYYCELKASKEADILISVSDKDSTFIKNIFLGSDAKVITTGLSRFEFQNISQEISATSYPSACFIGNYFHYPNLDGLIWYLSKVHGIILKNVPDYKFGIIGKGNPEALDRLKEQYKHFGNSLIWVGSVDKVAPAISPYTICLSPLISGAGLRGKVIQFSALNKATVSTHIGICGTPFIHQDSIFATDDPVEFAQLAIKLLTDERVRNEMASKALKITEEQFSWSSSIKALEDFFQEGTK